MGRWLLAGLVLSLVVATGANAQGAAIYFDGCSVLDSGSPWYNHVMYTFSIQAGPDSVNDIHICILDSQEQPVEVVAISHPESWNGHFEAGSNCIDYWTNGQAVAPGEIFGTFDFIVPPGFCSITVEWIFTYARVGVAAGFNDWTCIYTDVEQNTWSGIKALYR